MSCLSTGCRKNSASNVASTSSPSAAPLNLSEAITQWESASEAEIQKTQACLESNQGCAEYLKSVAKNFRSRLEVFLAADRKLLEDTYEKISPEMVEISKQIIETKENESRKFDEYMFVARALDPLSKYFAGNSAPDPELLPYRQAVALALENPVNFSENLTTIKKANEAIESQYSLVWLLNLRKAGNKEKVGTSGQSLSLTESFSLTPAEILQDAENSLKARTEVFKQMTLEYEKFKSLGDKQSAKFVLERIKQQAASVNAAQQKINDIGHAANLKQKADFAAKFAQESADAAKASKSAADTAKAAAETTKIIPKATEVVSDAGRLAKLTDATRVTQLTNFSAKVGGNVVVKGLGVGGRFLMGKILMPVGVAMDLYTTYQAAAAYADMRSAEDSLAKTEKWAAELDKKYAAAYTRCEDMVAAMEVTYCGAWVNHVPEKCLGFLEFHKNYKFDKCIPGVGTVGFKPHEQVFTKAGGLGINATPDQTIMNMKEGCNNKPGYMTCRKYADADSCNAKYCDGSTLLPGQDRAISANERFEESTGSYYVLTKEPNGKGFRKEYTSGPRKGEVQHLDLDLKNATVTIKSEAARIAEVNAQRAAEYEANKAYEQSDAGQGIRNETVEKLGIDEANFGDGATICTISSGCSRGAAGQKTACLGCPSACGCR